MKKYTFTAYCTFGKGDSGESWLEIELTDEEAERLERYALSPEVYYNGFSCCKELSDLYNRIYTIAINQMTEEMRDFGDLDEELAQDPNWKIDDMYACGVHFPFEFENLLKDD